MRSSLRSGLLALPLAGAACAHGAPPVAADGAPLQRIVVTGSHIPQWVDPRNGLPNTTSPVTIWTPHQLDRAGLPPSDVGAALRKLDPST